MENSVNSGTCQAQTKSGSACKAKATSNGLCSMHSDPKRAAELGRKSGEARRAPEAFIVLPQPRTAVDVHGALGQVFSEMGSGKIAIKLGTSLAYVASVLLKTLEVSDHEVRLRAIEQMMISIRRRSSEK